MIAALLIAAAICPTCIHPTKPGPPILCVPEQGPIVFYTKSEMGWPLFWPPMPVSHDVLTGTLGTPVALGTCAVAYTGYLHLIVPDPPPGEGRWWLVRGWNVCGSGTWGFDGSGIERIAAACGP